MVTVLQTLTENLMAMQMFDDPEHASRSLNARTYYEISANAWRIILIVVTASNTRSKSENIVSIVRTDWMAVESSFNFLPYNPDFKGPW